MTKLKAWYQASRPPFFVATVIPLLLGGVAAGSEGAWNTERWLVALVASFFVHLATNLANDYFDYTSGADSGDSIGGSRVIQQGWITPRQLVVAMFLLYSLALICGLWILWETKLWWLIAVMLFSFFSSLFYTAPPFRYGYHGLGELFVGLNMGPIMVVGTYAILTESVSWKILALSLPVALMVSLILFYQSLSDIDADRQIGKKTIAVRAGKRGSVLIYRMFIILIFASILLLVIARWLPLFALISLIAIIPAINVDRMIRTTENWLELHDRGGKVRFIYLFTGIVLILSKGLF